MATKLLKAIHREAPVNGKPYIITLDNDVTITFREKGRKTKFTCSLQSVYNLALIDTVMRDYRRKVEIYQQKKRNGKKHLKQPKKPFIARAYNPVYSHALKLSA